MGHSGSGSSNGFESLGQMTDRHLNRQRCDTPSRGRVLAAWLPIACMPSVSEAQVRTDIDRAPTLTIERHLEDWSYLAGSNARKGRWPERSKYVPLGEDGAVYLTTGLEARSRYERYAHVNWGSAPDDAYVWHRLMPYADLHVGPARVFAQPIVSGISGARRRPRYPTDTTGADLLQVFVAFETDVADEVSLAVSAGRKLTTLGAGRFINPRYGPGVPQAYDGVDLAVTGRTRQVTVVYFRPVDTRPGHFNDHASRQKATWGAYATQWLGGGRSSGVDAYYLGFRDRGAVFDQGTGRHVVHTFGTRVFADTGAWFGNVEGAIQKGAFAGRPSSAWGMAGEIGHRLARPLKPELKLAADVLSGDGDRDDPRLGTFNPLFPNGKYLGALTPVGPRNLIHVRPAVAIQPRADMRISLTAAAFWRQSLEDGVYAIPGVVLRGGDGSDARFIGKQFELASAWQITPELNLSASASVFQPGRFIRDTGPARPIRMVGAMANFRF